MTFFTGSHVVRIDDNHVTWREGCLRPFQAPRRLVFRFGHENALAAQSVAQVVAAQHGGGHAWRHISRLWKYSTAKE